jgi:transposase
MSDDWLRDARKIPDAVMSAVRKLAVRAIEEKGHRPELAADLFGISRRPIDDWLRRDRRGGYSALETLQSPGAPPLMTPEMDAWLRQTVLDETPRWITAMRRRGGHARPSPHG